MWLVNDSTAREFEVPMFKKLGFPEIFLPKKFPPDLGFRSAGVDFSEDAGLSIPEADLADLNAVDWYGNPGRNAWDLANRHFEMLFFVPWGASSLKSVAGHFQGAVILRAYGLSDGNSYGETVRVLTGGVRCLENLGRRFSFGAAYDCLAEIEAPWFQERTVYLPLGLQDCQARNEWKGNDPRILFVCPDIEANPYYQDIYRDCKREFRGLPYAVAGAQVLASNDPHLLGFVSANQHVRSMREFRVMFYHNKEPRQVHYTLFEAVREGMPVVFLAGGLLDRLGGAVLPGRCRNYREARSKIQRILDNDRTLIDRIRTSQSALLDRMRPEAIEPIWRRGISRVLSGLDSARKPRPGLALRPKIAVMLPMPYRGDTLRAAKMVAEAMWKGSREAGEDAEVVFGYPEPEANAPERWDKGLPETIARRTLNWSSVDPDSALRAMRQSGNWQWAPEGNESYLIPDDGINHMCDCDLWIVISDRLSAPLLPIRRYVLVAYDYVQRYGNEASAHGEYAYIAAARAADRVLVTTRFTEQDALVYAGLPRERVVPVPPLLPTFPAAPSGRSAERYFLWPTNVAPHKNHVRAVAALREYYERWDGLMECRITGLAGSRSVLAGVPHLQPLLQLVTDSTSRKWVRHLGELPDHSYRRELSGAQFLWHPAKVDNGTFSVVEAALMGVPSLSSRYPAMEEMDATFKLHLTWMDWSNPEDMARMLKEMEQRVPSLRATLPCPQDLSQYSPDALGQKYWNVVRECL